MPHTSQRESSLHQIAWMQRQRCVQRGWACEREEVPSHSAAVIVGHGGEPRLGNLAVRTDRHNVSPVSVRFLRASAAKPSFRYSDTPTLSGAKADFRSRCGRLRRQIARNVLRQLICKLIG